MSKKHESLVAWSRQGDLIRLAARCGRCGGTGRFTSPSDEHLDCKACAGLGWFGIDPKLPVMAKVGSVAKVAVLSVRYATGSPLWIPEDGYNAELNTPGGELVARSGQPADSNIRRKKGADAQRRMARLAP